MSNILSGFFGATSSLAEGKGSSGAALPENVLAEISENKHFGDSGSGAFEELLEGGVSVDSPEKTTSLQDDQSGSDLLSNEGKPIESPESVVEHDGKNTQKNPQQPSQGKPSGMIVAADLGVPASGEGTFSMPMSKAGESKVPVVTEDFNIADSANSRVIPSSQFLEKERVDGVLPLGFAQEQENVSEASAVRFSEPDSEVSARGGRLLEFMRDVLGEDDPQDPQSLTTAREGDLIPGYVPQSAQVVNSAKDIEGADEKRESSSGLGLVRGIPNNASFQDLQEAVVPKKEEPVSNHQTGVNLDSGLYEEKDAAHAVSALLYEEMPIRELESSILAEPREQSKTGDNMITHKVEGYVQEDLLSGDISKGRVFQWMETSPIRVNSAEGSMSDAVFTPLRSRVAIAESQEGSESHKRVAEVIDTLTFSREILPESEDVLRGTDHTDLGVFQESLVEDIYREDSHFNDFNKPASIVLRSSSESRLFEEDEALGVALLSKSLSERVVMWNDASFSPNEISSFSPNTFVDLKTGADGSQREIVSAEALNVMPGDALPFAEKAVRESSLRAYTQVSDEYVMGGQIQEFFVDKPLTDRILYFVSTSELSHAESEGKDVVSEPIPVEGQAANTDSGQSILGSSYLVEKIADEAIDGLGEKSQSIEFSGGESERSSLVPGIIPPEQNEEKLGENYNIPMAREASQRSLALGQEAEQPRDQSVHFDNRNIPMPRKSMIAEDYGAVREIRQPNQMGDSDVALDVENEDLYENLSTLPLRADVAPREGTSSTQENRVSSNKHVSPVHTASQGSISAETEVTRSTSNVIEKMDSKEEDSALIKQGVTPRVSRFEPMPRTQHSDSSMLAGAKNSPKSLLDRTLVEGSRSNDVPSDSVELVDDEVKVGFLSKAGMPIAQQPRQQRGLAGQKIPTSFADTPVPVAPTSMYPQKDMNTIPFAEESPESTPVLSSLKEEEGMGTSSSGEKDLMPVSQRLQQNVASQSLNHSLPKARSEALPAVPDLNPKLLRQLEQFQRSQRPWAKISLPMDGGEDLMLRMKVSSGQVQIRFGTQSVPLRDGLERGWPELVSQAASRGILLGAPEFETRLKTRVTSLDSALMEGSSDDSDKSIKVSKKRSSGSKKSVDPHEPLDNYPGVLKWA